MKELNLTDISSVHNGQIIKSASVLLDSIDTKQSITLDKEITEALISFLQSEVCKKYFLNKINIEVGTIF